jgi:hypothetical protein
MTSPYAYQSTPDKRRLMQRWKIDNVGYIERWKMIGILLLVFGGLGIFLFPVLAGAVISAMSGSSSSACCSQVGIILAVLLIVWGVYILRFKTKQCTYYTSRFDRKLKKKDIKNIDRFFKIKDMTKKSVDYVVYYSRTTPDSKQDSVFGSNEVKLVVKLDYNEYADTVEITSYTYSRGRITDPTDSKSKSRNPYLREDYSILNEFHNAFGFPFTPTSNIEPIRSEKVVRAELDGPVTIIEAPSPKPRPKPPYKPRSSPKKKPSKPPQSKKPSKQQIAAHAEMVPCMHCGEPVDFMYSKCPYCGENFL